jgi:beta-glucosidase
MATTGKLLDRLAQEAFVDALLSRMTLAEKIGQMTQAEKNSITPDDVTAYAIGSVLSGGGGNPTPNTVHMWAAMVRAYQDAALQTRLAIPLIYGSDAVHGHNNMRGAVIFPHNIGLGATRDAELVERIARATAHEMLAVNVHWNFAPAVSTPQDIRWGRIYEGYSEHPDVVMPLALAYLRGLQGSEPRALASVKHYVGDGATTWGTTHNQEWAAANNWQGATIEWRIDQGDAQIDEAELRALHLPPYKAAVEAGALNIMVSFSSWNGEKLHGHRYLLTEVLKEEFGFEGFLVSDWRAIDQLDRDYRKCVVTAINAGLDMVMVPYDYRLFINTLTDAVNCGDVPMERIDDAVRRILRAKIWLGVFDQPYTDPGLLSLVGSKSHRALGREAVQKSLVLLKHENDVLPLAKSLPLLVAGDAADDLGMQCGGWTIEWQGGRGRITAGTTLLEGLQQVAGDGAQIAFSASGDFGDRRAPVGVVVIGEHPYAEGFGDCEDPSLTAQDIALVQSMRARCDRLVLVLVSGRPRIISAVIDAVDAVAAAWLPGTEGAGVADVLYGDAPFSGKLAYSWPRDLTQIPRKALLASESGPLFAFGHGLTL